MLTLPEQGGSVSLPHLYAAVLNPSKEISGVLLVSYCLMRCEDEGRGKEGRKGEEGGGGGREEVPIFPPS